MEKNNLSVGLSDYKGTNIEKSFIENDLEKAGRGAPVGTINVYNEIKMPDGSWKWITKKMRESGEVDRLQSKGGKKTEAKNEKKTDYKIGDVVSVDGEREGKIVKLPSETTEQYSVDFGNGNVYGIMPNRISSEKKQDKKEKKQDKVEDFELRGYTWKFKQGEDSASIENSDGTKYFAKPDESNKDFVDRVKKTIKEDFKENLNISVVINSIDEFRDFIDSYSDEILLNVEGESDGWNQKITAINKILNDNNIEVADNIWNDDELEDIINGI